MVPYLGWVAVSVAVGPGTGRTPTGPVVMRRNSVRPNPRDIGTFRMAGFRPRPGADVSVTGRGARMGSPVPNSTGPSSSSALAKVTDRHHWGLWRHPAGTRIWGAHPGTPLGGRGAAPSGRAEQTARPATSGPSLLALNPARYAIHHCSRLLRCRPAITDIEGLTEPTPPGRSPYSKEPAQHRFIMALPTGGIRHRCPARVSLGRADGDGTHGPPERCRGVLEAFPCVRWP